MYRVYIDSGIINAAATLIYQPSMEETMDMTQSSTKPERTSTVVYWHDNQLVLTHHSRLNISAGKERIIASLNLDMLDTVLYDKAGYHIESFTTKDVPHSHRPDRDHDRDHDRRHAEREGKGEDTGAGESSRHSLQSPVGKYLFPHPSEEGTITVSFFHLAQNQPIKGADKTGDVVRLINEKPEMFDRSTQSKLLAAMPNWLNGGTNTNCPDHITHGCPVSPPIPVGDACAPGNWHFVLPPELPPSLLAATGAGVVVFVLDTLPQAEQIYRAVTNSGASNALLLDIVENVALHYQLLPDSLDVPDPMQPATGDDIYGRTVGFPMNDHGLFITGIIRDLAPDSRVECIRVLNDYCVGDTSTLMNAFAYIQNRLSSDLSGSPVVVNLSLVATPAEEELASWGYTDQSIAPARLGLLLPMQALAAQGVVFAASSGNGSGPHDKITNPPGERVKPHYPAAFAYPLPGVNSAPDLPAMIPVGAVNQSGAAASYSNYPGPLGIGAYGGEIPQPIPAQPDATQVTRAQLPIDAPRGVYTASLYPALSETDQLSMRSPAPVSYPEYEPSPADTWAYWSGTSFATPIISALAARVMELQPSVGDSVRQTLLAIAPAQVEWTNLDTGGNARGPLIMTQQECESVTIVEIL